jgi:uncharacterized protein
MKKKAHFDYPCAWVYKVIGSSEESIRRAIKEIIQDESCSVTLSSSSKTGKYHCINLELIVCSEEHRVSIYESLRKHPSVKIIL